MKKGVFGILTLLCLGLSLFLFGCETSLDLPSTNLPKLTIIAHVAPQGEKPQRVYVYASQSPSDSSQFYTPAQLVVEVSEAVADSILSVVRLDAKQDGTETYFQFPDGFLKEGYTYSITAWAPGFETVHATTVIPRASTISNLSIQDIRIEPSDKNDFKKIVRYKLVFSINHVEANRYYHLIFYNKYKGINNAYLIDPQLSDNQPFLHHYDFGILIDKRDLKTNEPLTFNFVDWELDNFDLERVYVELRTITEEYYKYHSSLARQLIVRQDPFAEPVTIFNNIEGGYGNFSGFIPDVSSSDLPE